jgi:hypothetical protein
MGRAARGFCQKSLKRPEFIITEHGKVAPLLLYRPAVDSIRLRENLAERFHALAHFAQCDNRASKVALGFRPGKQFPSLALHPSHFVEQGFTKALFVLGLGSANRTGDVSLVA